MSVGRRILQLGCMHAIGVLAACVGNQQTAVTFASREMACEAVYVEELQDDRYRAVGCGESRIYHCMSGRCWREGWLARNARTRASREFGCSPEQIKVRWVQEETYRVEACGREATYACDRDECHLEGPEHAPTPVPVIVVSP